MLGNWMRIRTQVVHNLLVAVVKSGLAIRAHFIPLQSPGVGFRPGPIALECWKCCDNGNACDEGTQYLHCSGVVKENVSIGMVWTGLQLKEDGQVRVGRKTYFWLSR
jgi:hypothetical protein